MLKFSKKKEKTELEEAIDVRIANLSVSQGEAEEDKKSIDNLKELVSVKTELEGRKHSIDPNTILSVAGSLAGVLLVINHERLNVITSKAMGLILRIKG